MCSGSSILNLIMQFVYVACHGKQVILQNEGNVILSEGLVLQDAGLWGKTLDEISTPFNNRMELYF